MTVKEVTEKTFEQEVLNANKPVLIDFYAPWCGDCKRIGPVLEFIAAEYADRFTVVKIDAERETSLKQKYDIQAYPTLCVIQNGKPGKYIVEPSSKDEIVRFLQTEGVL